MTHDPFTAADMAPVKIYLRSYENKDELYYEEYCRGMGDPDYYGYPGQEEDDSSEGTRTIDQKPF